LPPFATIMTDQQIDQKLRDLEHKITQISNSVSSCALAYDVTANKREIARFEHQLSEMQRRIRTLEKL